MSGNEDPFVTDFQRYVYVSKYSRYLHDLNRRETWSETVSRYFDFFEKHLKEKHGYELTSDFRSELSDAVYSMNVMPSMRCIMTAGPALEKANQSGFNCAYQVVDSPRVFSEIMFTLLCGTGVGFSVERQYVNKLPEVPDQFFPTDTTIVVADSKVGWAKALNELVQLLYTGCVPKWDTSKVRPAGSILKTFGGRASGPEALVKSFQFIVKTFKEAAGRKLTSLECHDIVCVIGESVVVGGVRRSALISLSNLSDERMRSAKTGQWWMITPWRSLANNSAVYTDKKPSMDTFMAEWKSLYDSKSGERGIFSRYAARSVIERSNQFRKDHFSDAEGIRYREVDHEWGCNPCSEIILRDRECCNLSEVIIRSTDTVEDIDRKVRIAAIFGTFQSTLTDFKFVSKKWRDNMEDERLLGVSLTGIMDNKLTSGKLGKEKLVEALTRWRKTAILTNLEFSKKLNVPASAACTATKPSGTVSSLVDSSAGIHARHSGYYIRTARSDKKDPLTQLMIDEGVPHEDDVMRPESTVVFSFPQRSPKSAVFREDLSAIDQLEMWLTYQLHWCDHKPSVTVSVKEDEWLDVGAWVYRNFEWVSGISFLPYADHSYAQAPYQECTREEYDAAAKKMPSRIRWERLVEYEKSDSTTGSQEYACAAGGCDV